jgi:DNA-binding XRE family transcriptional regulator
MKKKKIYAKLRYMRERFGISPEVFAKLIGCGVENYSAKEHGRVPWFLTECQNIKGYIDKLLVNCGEPPITIDDLFKADEIEKRITKKQKQGA